MIELETCPACRQPYDGTSCTGRLPLKDGEQTVPHVPNTPHWDDGHSECEDCGARPGGVHHPGCRLEDCPLCSCQLISCRCFREEVHPQVWDDLELPENMKPMRQDVRYSLRDLGVL